MKSTLVNPTTHVMNCKNCNAEINSNFCANCGQASALKRIDWDYMMLEIVRLLHVERGILFTVKALITQPGQSIQQYLSENRSRLVKPIYFIIITSLIYSLASSFFHFEDGYVAYVDNNKTATNAIFAWVREHYGYANLLMGAFIALWIKLFFRKYHYNIFEILILLCYVMAMGMLILTVFGIIEGLTHLKVLQFGSWALFIYVAWAIGQFFDKNKVSSYVKAFFAYLLGMVLFIFITIMIGALIDFIQR